MKEPQPPAINTRNNPSPLPAAKPPRFLVIGAGSRGTAYARAVTTTTVGVIHAVAEPHIFKRQEFGRNFVWGDKGSPQEGQEFQDWREWLKWELERRQQSPAAAHPAGVDGVFICTLDETHIEILQAIAPLKLHILCEKPLALSLADCLTAYRLLGGLTPSTIFSIGHVLRYSPHNILLRKLLLVDRVIGDIVSLEHCEPIGWWHFAHSYVRGNWRRQTPAGDGSLLTKSCHDIDFILWLLCSPPPPSEEDAAEINEDSLRPHLPRSISSTGSLTQFRPARKPVAAGNSTNCLSCPAEQDCNYSALKIYRDMHVKQSIFDWPVNIVCPDIEDVVRPVLPATLAANDAAKSAAVDAAETHLLNRLREDYSRDTMTDQEIASRPWYGRCVYDSDNTACDDQVVTITWDDEQPSPPPSTTTAPKPTSQSLLRTAKTATFHMIAPTEKQCERRGRVYGTLGEISYDSRTISVYTFATRSTTTIEVPRQPPEEEKSHGGGDYGLARSFVRAVDAVVNGGWEVPRAQRRFVGCTLEEAVRSHALVFAAEEARREEKVVKWKEWWGEKVHSI